MAQKQLTNKKMFNSSWSEKDEAVLLDLLHRKVGELKFEIRDAESPYVKARLRAKRREYQALIMKVTQGDYNSSILAAEMASARVYKSEKSEKNKEASGKYANSYSDVNFDFQGYFNKTRFFGASLPIILIVLMAAFLFVTLCGTFIPMNTITDLETDLNTGDTRLSIGTVAYFKLGPDEADLNVPNDGNWPKAVYSNPSAALAQGELYKATDGTFPDRVYLYRDLKIVAIEVTNVDIIKALFRTPLLSEKRLDSIEDLDSMEGVSWYYQKFMRLRSDAYKMERGEDGKYSSINIVRHIATYGTIICMVLMIVFAGVELFISIGRLFSYTSRRIHVFPLFTLICGLGVLFLPMFLYADSLDGNSLKVAFDNYFMIYWEDFIYASDSQVAFSLLFALSLALPFIDLILPLFFKNKLPKPITYVPKGNSPHTFPGQTAPTKAGDVVPEFAPAKAKKKKARPSSLTAMKEGPDSDKISVGPYNFPTSF